MLWWSATLCAQSDVFEGAQWIAMEADSTILFPHIHLLKKSSEKGQSLKQYALPVFERQVPLRQCPIKRAQASVCGLGQYELFINGQRVGQHFLDPGWTMYNKELLYNTFDVTPHLSTNVSQPSSLNSQLSTLNPQPSTLNSQPSTTIPSSSTSAPMSRRSRGSRRKRPHFMSMTMNRSVREVTPIRR